MKHLKTLFLAFSIVTLPLIGIAQTDCIPEKPKKERLVNDFAEIFSSQEIAQLERRLVNFNDTTSTQIAVVTVEDLCGYDPAEFAFEIGETWGVGDRKFNNGVVILLKPKTTVDKGQTHITVGYGLEGVLPDAIAKRIVNNEMIPRFKQNDDYYGGITAAVQVVMDITGGEYSAENYNKRNKKKKESIPLIPLIFVLFFIVIMIAGTMGRARKYAHRNNMSLWAALFLMGSANRRHRGHYNNFNSGRGGFGGFGGGGGFGGFGGGSFGGGGAGGSW